jgi:glycosyltransferase involved in cell wall biosynthesis
VVAEAMARGLPIVTMAVGGLPHLIDHGRNGMLIEPNSIDEFAETVKKVRTDSQLRAKLARDGLQTAEKLTFESNKQRLEEIFTSELLRE